MRADAHCGCLKQLFCNGSLEVRVLGDAACSGLAWGAYNPRKMNILSWKHRIGLFADSLDVSWLHSMPRASDESAFVASSAKRSAKTAGSDGTSSRCTSV